MASKLMRYQLDDGSKPENQLTPYHCHSLHTLAAIHLCNLRVWKHYWCQLREVVSQGKATIVLCDHHGKEPFCLCYLELTIIN